MYNFQLDLKLDAQLKGKIDIKELFNKGHEIRVANPFYDTVQMDKRGEKKLLNKTRDVDSVSISFVASPCRKADKASRLLTLAAKSFN